MSEVAGGAPEQAPSGTAAPGAMTVSDEVVEKIAGAAARSVPGVVELGGDVARFFNSVLDHIGLDEVGDATRGISAQIKGTNVVVNVVLVIAAGYVVVEVAEAVRVAVTEALRAYGLQVTAVNIKVDDIALGGPPA